MFTVSDMMTPNPHTLQPHNTLADAKAIMEDVGIRHIPVTDMDKQLIGIVTQRDVLSAQESSLEHITKNNFLSTLDIPLEKCMHHTLMSVDPHASLKDAAIYMQKHKIGCLPVVEKKTISRHNYRCRLCFYRD
jgi:CBS domain-containing protein